MVKALLVDDEELAIMELQYLIEKNEGIAICGTATSGKETLEKYEELAPDVLFLDIQLNDANGLDIAERIRKISGITSPMIIFVTAYDEYALRAFELNAIDYILKPFSEERINETVSRVIERSNSMNIPQMNIAKELNILAVEAGGKLKILDINDIIYIEAQGRNTIIYGRDNIYNSSYSLKELEKRLENKQFFKPHRSYLINLHMVNEVIPWFKGTYQIIMKKYTENMIPVSRQNFKKFKTIIRM